MKRVSLIIMASSLSSNPTMTNAPGGPAKASLAGSRKAVLTDWIFRHLTLVFAVITILLIVMIAWSLYRASLPSIHHSGVKFFTTSEWDPVAPDEGKKTGDLYGVLPFVYGTLVTSFL